MIRNNDVSITEDGEQRSSRILIGMRDEKLLIEKSNRICVPEKFPDRSSENLNDNGTGSGMTTILSIGRKSSNSPIRNTTVTRLKNLMRVGNEASNIVARNLGSPLIGSMKCMTSKVVSVKSVDAQRFASSKVAQLRFFQSTTAMQPGKSGVFSVTPVTQLLGDSTIVSTSSSEPLSI